MAKNKRQINRKALNTIYGQEYTATTYKLAKMNLAIRGIAGNLGEVPAVTFFKDQHEDLKADFIMANPPFNLKEWRGNDELIDDPRWSGYEVPPNGSMSTIPTMVPTNTGQTHRFAPTRTNPVFAKRRLWRRSKPMTMC